MEGQTTTEGTSSQLTNTLTTAVQNVDQKTNAQGRSDGSSNTNARQQTSTRTTNRTVKQTLVPTIMTKEVISSIQFYSKEEIEWAAASEFKRLGTGEAIVTIDGEGVWQCQTPLAKTPFSHAPKYAATKLKSWQNEMLQRPEFASPQQIQQEREEFLTALTSELRLLTHQQSQGTLNATGGIVQAPPRLIVDIDSDHDDPQVTF